MSTPSPSDPPRFEHGLVASLEQHGVLLDGMLDPVVAIDTLGIIRFANRACQETFGYSPEELVGQNVKLLMPEPQRSAHDGYLEEYRRTGKTFILGNTRELPGLHRDGRPLDLELSVARVPLSGGEDVLLCGSMRDITARKRTERALVASQQRFRMLFDQEFHYVGLLRPDGRIVELNGAALELAGQPPEELEGLAFWDAPYWSHSEAERKRIRAAVASAAAGELVRFETTSSTPGGRVILVDFSIKPFFDERGEIQLLLPEGRDITDVQRAREREMAMMRSFAEVGESASLLAHEIKNPITAVNAALRAVAQQLGEDEQEVLHDLVARMQKLEKLMRRTLSLTRPLQHDPVRCEARALFEDVGQLLAQQMSESGTQLELDVSSDVDALFADPDLIDEVLVNLVNNALQAGAGRVRLGAKSCDGRVTMRVEDDGPGIPESVLGTLFKPFVSTKSNGTGLGLAIARKVLEAHGGEISVGESELGGARFELDLPAYGPALGPTFGATIG